MRSTALSSLFACSLSLMACSSNDPLSTGTTTGTPGDDPLALTIHTGEFQVDPGDSFECFYTDTITDKELSAVSATAVQGSGGHHVTIYYTDNPRDAQHHPCTDVEMASWHQVGAAGGNGTETGAEGLIQLPPGLAIKIAAGKQIVVQAHYINTTGAAEKVNDTITLHLADPKDVKEYANYHVLNEDQFEIPPQASLTSQRTCTIDADLDAVVVLGHMHESGRHFKLEVAPSEGQPYETLYEHDWQELYVSHPPVMNYTMDKPLHFAKGTKLRQTCKWDNTKTNMVHFPNEMCISFMYYFPDQGERYCPKDPLP